MGRMAGKTVQPEMERNWENFSLALQLLWACAAAWGEGRWFCSLEAYGIGGMKGAGTGGGRSSGHILLANPGLASGTPGSWLD